MLWTLRRLKFEIFQTIYNSYQFTLVTVNVSFKGGYKSTANKAIVWLIGNDMSLTLGHGYDKVLTWVTWTLQTDHAKPGIALTLPLKVWNLSVWPNGFSAKFACTMLS